ncbi:transglutaminaseTgpA domain-containing protein [Paeniglutamicibacter psychrophenolicus]|nr:transglutaminaseTgpA domain-containing protein [Paeniglutamicibacter psychrophenolicus]
MNPMNPMNPMNARNAKLPMWRYGLDAGCLGVALFLGALGLADAYGTSAHYLLACLGGIIAGLALAWAHVYFRLRAWQTMALFAGAYLLLGTVLATPREALFGVLPTFESLRVLLAGVVFSWKDMLTVAPPVGSYGGVLIVAFLSTALTGLLAGLAAWRLRAPYWTLLPLLAMFVVGIAFGTRDVPLPVLRGGAFMAVLVGWLAWRRHIGSLVADGFRSLNHPDDDVRSVREGLIRRVGIGAVVLLAASGITAAAAPLISPPTPRQVLRDAVEPPVDLYTYPSPLTNFRKYTKTMAEATLLTVTGLPEGERVRLAALDSYNGMVFNLDPKSGGNFAPVGDSADIRGSGSAAQRAAGELEIGIGDYAGVWLPGGGRLAGVHVADEGREQLARSLFYSDEAETALSSIGLQKGDSYTAQVQFPVRATDAELENADFAQLRMPELANVPPLAAAKSVQYVGSARTALQRARALETALKTGGFLSSGAEGQVPSLSGHGAGRITSLLDAEDPIGDDEQYAVAMALMAREQGMPARVVMGFYPEKYDPAAAVELKGSDAHAWVEIAFESIGWVTFDPTPDDDEQPTPPEQEPRAVPQPQVLQPPPPEQQDAELPPETAPEPQEVQEEEPSFWETWGALVIGTAIGLGSLLLLASPFLLILGLKLRRRRRRAQAGSIGARIAGGWQEVLSQGTDYGIIARGGATRRENAGALAAGFPVLGTLPLELAARADRATFSTGVPGEDEAANYWRDVDDQAAKMGAATSFWRRQRARFSARSLLHEWLAALSARGARAAPGPLGGKPAWRRPGARARTLGKVHAMETKE